MTTSHDAGRVRDWQQAIGAEIDRQCGIGAGTCGTLDDGSGLFEVQASLDLNGFAQAMLAFADEATRPPAQAGAAEAMREACAAEVDRWAGPGAYVGDDLTKFVRGLAASVRAVPAPAASGEIPGGVVAEKSPYDRNCHFCGLGWTGAHKHGCPRAMEDYSGGPADD